MKFLSYFRAFSYAMIGVAMLALVLAGGLDIGLALDGEGRVADLVAGSAVGESWRAALVEHPDLRTFHDPD